MAEQQEQVEQIEQVEQEEQGEQVEKTEQTEQAEKTEKTEQAEQTEQTEQAEQTEQTDQAAEQTEQTEQVESPGPPGGWTDVTDADPQTSIVQQVADGSKADAEKEAGVTFARYLVVRHRHKVVSGIIYLLDVQVSDEDNGYVHVQVHADPQHVLHLIAVKTGFTKDASLEPLQEPTEKEGEESENIPPPGSWTDVQDADLPTAMAQHVADNSRGDAEKEAGKTFTQYLVVKHRHKVISGIIYLLEVQVSDEEDGYAHIEVHVDAQQVYHFQGIKTGFTKDASLDPLTTAEGKEKKGKSKRGCTVS